MSVPSCEFSQCLRLFRSTHIRGHALYSVFSLKSHSRNTGPWQISNTGPNVILGGDSNGAIENFQPNTGPHIFSMVKLTIPLLQKLIIATNNKKLKDSAESLKSFLC